MGEQNDNIPDLFTFHSFLSSRLTSAQVASLEDGEVLGWGEERNQRDSATGRCVGRGGARRAGGNGITVVKENR